MVIWRPARRTWFQFRIASHQVPLVSHQLNDVPVSHVETLSQTRLLLSSFAALSEIKVLICSTMVSIKGTTFVPGMWVTK